MLEMLLCLFVSAQISNVECICSDYEGWHSPLGARLAPGKKVRPYNNAPNWAYMREADTMRLLVTMRLTRRISYKLA